MAASNFPAGFAHGAIIQNIPVVNTYGGKVFWVDDSGAAGNEGTFNKPVATIQQGIDKCLAGRGDIVMVKAGHAETITAQIDGDTSDVAVVGLGSTPTQMPTITVNGAIDGIDVSAANFTIANIRFAAPETDEQTADINVDAAGCSLLNTYHIGSQTSKNKIDIITLTANADDCLIDGARIYNDVVECVSGIVLEGACERPEIRNCFIYDDIGWTNGAISDEAIAKAVYIHHNVFVNGKAATVAVELGQSIGIASFNHVSGRHTTIASNVSGASIDFFENRVTEEAALNGMIMPAADAE